jgi:hypothetical protein
MGPDTFRISWSWDRYYTGSRLRYPQSMQRITDRAGAERFAKKWKVEMPSEPHEGRMLSSEAIRKIATEHAEALKRLAE